MHDGVDAGDGALDLRHVGEIGGHEDLLGGKVGWRLHVAQAQTRIDACEQDLQAPADVACRSGDEDGLDACHRQLSPNAAASR